MAKVATDPNVIRRRLRAKLLRMIGPLREMQGDLHRLIETPGKFQPYDRTAERLLKMSGSAIEEAATYLEEEK